MEPPVRIIRTELEIRREKLLEAFETLPEAARLSGLLQEVDAALERLDRGSFGLCETCHEPIEADRLMADPLVRLCLDHLDNAQQRRLEQDLHLVSKIQAALLPKPDLQWSGWEVSYHYSASDIVSGDYCDLVRSGKKDEGFLFAVGDVSGKGLAASMMMSHLHALLRSLADFSLPVDEMMVRVNRLFCESTLASHYSTLVCGRALTGGLIEVCNAGHPPPILVRRRNVQHIEATGLPIGLFCDGAFSIHTETMSPGDILLLYTDGLSEAHGGKEEYGTGRIERILKTVGGSSAHAIVQAVLEDLSSFLGKDSRRLSDDLTVMAVRRAANA